MGEGILYLVSMVVRCFIVHWNGSCHKPVIVVECHFTFNWLVAIYVIMIVVGELIHMSL